MKSTTRNVLRNSINTKTITIIINNNNKNVNNSMKKKKKKKQKSNQKSPPPSSQQQIQTQQLLNNESTLRTHVLSYYEFNGSVNAYLRKYPTLTKDKLRKRWESSGLREILTDIIQSNPRIKTNGKDYRKNKNCNRLYSLQSLIMPYHD